MPGLYDLAVRLRAYADGTLDRAALDAWCAPVLAGEPLGADYDDDAEWSTSPDEERLYWRLLYLLETTDTDDAALRALAGRVLDCLAHTASAADTLELLPLVADAPRLCTIVAKRAEGIVSRTGFLNVVANAPYPPHVKLWLERAGPTALAALCAAMHDGAWQAVARRVERAPVDRDDGVVG
jgi:hypothetical protein